MTKGWFYENPPFLVILRRRICTCGFEFRYRPSTRVTKGRLEEVEKLDFHLFSILHHDREHLIRDEYLFDKDFSLQPLRDIRILMCERRYLVLCNSVKTIECTTEFSVHLYCDRHLIINEHELIIFWPSCLIDRLVLSKCLVEFLRHMWSKWMQ